MADNEITQWEYKKILNTDEAELNKLGEQGWEVTGVLPRENGPDQTILKRQKVRQKQPEYGYTR